MIGYQNVFGSLGSALAFNGKLVVINYNLYEFTTPSLAKETHKNPERLPLQLLSQIM